MEKPLDDFFESHQINHKARHLVFRIIDVTGSDVSFEDKGQPGIIRVFSGDQTTKFTLPDCFRGNRGGFLVVKDKVKIWINCT